MQGLNSDHRNPLIDISVIKQNCEFIEKDEMLRLIAIFEKDLKDLIIVPLSGDESRYSVPADVEHRIRGSAAMIGAKYIAENLIFLTEPFLQSDNRKRMSIRSLIECI